jgi:hypothetical protein
VKEHELLSMIRDGLPYEDAIAYCDQAITSAQYIVDRFQRTVDSYTWVRATIVRYMEKDIQMESN